MKIIEEGQPQPAEAPRWWVGKIGKCPVCQIKVQFEAHDQVYSVVDSHGRTAQMSCFTQNCRGVISCVDGNFRT